MDYDVGRAQAKAAILREEMVGRRYRHYKGGEYLVTGVSVLESTGEIHVQYQGADGFVWLRSFSDFDSAVEVQRFERVTE